MWRLLLMTLLAATASGFLFPGQNPESQSTSSGSSVAEASVDPGTAAEGEEDYPDYGPTVDPGPGGLEERFFFGDSNREDIANKFGQAATSFLNTLTSSNGGSPPRRADIPDYGGPSVYGAVSVDPDYRGDVGYGGVQDYGTARAGVSDYNDYGVADPVEPPSHGFPVDQHGRILCSRVPRWQKKACRQARRKARRPHGRRPTGGSGGRRPGTGDRGTGSSVVHETSCDSPDEKALTHAKDKCCGLQQKGDIYGFNNCCQTVGFCPICEVDSKKLAQDECCPLQYEGDQLGYRQCCSKYGLCPLCEPPPPPPTPEAPAGCMYKGKLFIPDSEMDKLAYKCLFVRCKDNGNGPETVLEYLDQVGCCQRDKDLFPPGSVVAEDECTNLVCEDGEWVHTSSDLAAVFASPCPEGWIDLGGSCVYIWRELMTWANASAACGKLRGTLALPQNKAQLTQLINAFRNMKDRDSTVELGGWVNARDSGRQWQTPQGDTLTFAPWEEGAPDGQRRTACAGLTVTDRSQGWRDYLCNSRQNMLYPICQVTKPACGDTRDGCGPFEGDMMFPPNSDISFLSNSCETYRCNDHSYVVREVKPQCCYYHEWNGQAFGRDHGWHAGLFEAGGFQLYDGLLCECTDGSVDCTQFFD